jgi:branched-chain amino acid transport system substrate-binding protein
MTKKISVLLMLLMMIIGGAAAQDSEPIKIGAIFDLSGETSEVGTPYAQGMNAYIEFVNENGGINGQPLELLAGDAEYDVRRAEQLYGQLAAEGVVAVMGWGTEESLALASRAARDQIPFISASSSEELNDPSGFAPYNFLIAPTYGDQLVAMMFHMLELWEDEGNSAADMRIALFYHDSDFGSDPIATGEEFARQARIGGILAVPMWSEARDFTAELQQADDYGITHIIIQNLPRPAAQLATNITGFFGGITPGRVGCLNWCANEQFVELAGDSAENVLGAIPFAPTSVSVNGQQDAEDFLEARGQSLDDATLHFTQGWATMSILVTAIEQTSNAGQAITGANIRAALESMRNVDTGGLLAPVSFSPDDHRGTRALAIYVVQNGEWRPSSNVLDLR